MKKVRLQFVALAAIVPTALAGGFVAFQRTELRARYAGYQLRTASDDAGRTAAAKTLLTLGEPGAARLCEAIRSGPAEARTVASAEVPKIHPTDPVVAPLAVRCAAGFAAADDAGKDAILDLVPHFLRGEAPAVDAARAVVKLALADGSPTIRATAIPLAVRPDLGLSASAVALLDHPSAEVRRAAVVALAPPPATGNPAVLTEDWFRMLHDPDPDVRALVAAGLKARGLSGTDVAFGTKLAGPSSRDRLELLFELRWAGDAVKNPDLWLQRLGGDAEPAVRAGAARVAVELGLASSAGWVGALADRDPDESVRRVAGYYRSLAQGVMPAGYRP